MVVGDLVLSRDEHQPNGMVVAQRVQEVFVRTGIVWHLHIAGQLIRTTGEHPFYVFDRGWVPACGLNAGDVLLSDDGRTVSVDDVFDTGIAETVYNIRVSNYHTYFVGCDEWGFSVWAHNQCGVKDVIQYQKLKQQLRLEELRAKHGDVFRQRMAAATEAASPLGAKGQFGSYTSELSHQYSIVKSIRRHLEQQTEKTGVRTGVELRFGRPNPSWDPIAQREYLRHVGEQMLELNRLSLFRTDVLTASMERVRLRVAGDAVLNADLKDARDWGAGRLANIPSPLGTQPAAAYKGQKFQAGHFLDDVAGGYTWKFLRWVDSKVNAAIGSAWSKRLTETNGMRYELVRPGQFHWGME